MEPDSADPVLDLNVKRHIKLPTSFTEWFDSYQGLQDCVPSFAQSGDYEERFRYLAAIHWPSVLESSKKTLLTDPAHLALARSTYAVAYLWNKSVEWNKTAIALEVSFVSAGVSLLVSNSHDPRRTKSTTSSIRSAMILHPLVSINSPTSFAPSLATIPI